VGIAVNVEVGKGSGVFVRVGMGVNVASGVGVSVGGTDVGVERNVRGRFPLRPNPNPSPIASTQKHPMTPTIPITTLLTVF